MSSDPSLYATGTGAGPRTDWLAWHDAYDSSTSSLSRRVAVVRDRLSEVLTECGPTSTILSLCAGDGRDILDLDPRPTSVRTILVELNEELAHRAKRKAAGLPMVEIRCADASDLATIVDVVPVDVLLFCGILGNVDPDTVGDVVGRIAGLLRPGGTVIWTRGGSDPDQRQRVRGEFLDNGFDELSFDGEPERFGVGVSRLRTTAPAPPADTPLFTFIR